MSTPVDVVVLAKAPIAGLAKTRLIPALGARGAARLQRRFTLRALGTALRSEVGPVHLYCAPDTQHRFFRALARCGQVSLQSQAPSDLGERMRSALMLHHLSRPCILIGTDCPALTPQHLKRAAHVLISGQDAVFVPAEDGGYVLIGLARPVPGLFDGVNWSTPFVMDQTRQRLLLAHATWQEPAILWDVDTPSDLARLTQLNEKI